MGKKLQEEEAPRGGSFKRMDFLREEAPIGGSFKRRELH